MDRLDYYCYNNIFDILELKDQINYLFTCRIFYHNLSIKKISSKKKLFFSEEDNMPDVNLTQHMMKNYIFRNVISLNVSDNDIITNVSFMTKLKKLYVDHDCGIDQNGILGLNLIVLDVGFNSKIVDVSFMTKLKKLEAYGDSGIDQNGIKGLDLVELNATCNGGITDVSFMKNLKILDAAGSSCGIDQNGRIRESRFSNSTCRSRIGYIWTRFN
jgi:hypothetical protein